MVDPRPAIADEARAAWQRIGNPVWIARAELCLASREVGPDGMAAEDRARRRLRQLGVARSAIGPAGGSWIAGRAERELLEIEILGGFRVLRDGQPVGPSGWQSRKARELLQILVAHRGRTARRDGLMETLWPDDEADAQANRLSVALATVRAVLDPDRAFPPTWFVASDGEAYRLDLSHVAVDVELFFAHAREGQRMARERRPTEAREMLEIAESAYVGDVLEENPYADWAVGLREEARATYIAVARQLSSLAEARGDVDAAVRYRLRVIERDPFAEDAHLGLVDILARAGRHGDARRAYGSYVGRMRELDVEPAAFPTRKPRVSPAVPDPASLR
jgi:DNA-binding SARP family transcriptional activator